MEHQPGTARRYKASLSGTNLALTGDYNQRLVYQAIRRRGPITRNALIELTGLAKPTIAGIVRRLLAAGLVSETSRIYGARGQPAVHLEADRDGCFAVGLEVGTNDLRLVLIDAQGNVVRQTSWTLDASARGDVRAAMPGLIGSAPRDRIIGLGVAISSIDRGSETPQHDVGLAMLTDLLPAVPIFVDDRLAAGVAAESMFGGGPELRSYYYILLDDRPIGGLVLPQGLFRGAHPGRARQLFAEGKAGWADAAAKSADDAAWLDDACNDLVPLLVSINCLLDPGAVLVSGSLPAARLAMLADRCSAMLRDRASILPSLAPIRPAGATTDAVLIGAACLPMRARLYPTDEALLKSLDHAA